ncbi:hypothetical protein [Cellvibrio sp. NN19]|uniref:hypothetical protein n=1 Tax=Cellvibrio chitinivorans TaxID=3102792 RepID=UPI002B40737B|nr:hypothetical protein [Cellvibrio sp. NN19]
MYWLIFPAATAVIRHYVSSKISDAIFDGVREGIETAKTEALNTIYKGLYGAFLNISINIALLLMAVYLLPLFLEREMSIFFIANVYLASIMHGAYNTLSKIPVVYAIAFQYKLNFKSYIRDEIYFKAYKETHRRASNEIEDTFFVFKPFVYVFGDTPSEIAHRVAKGTSVSASEIIFHEIVKKILIIAIFIFSYFVMFRYVVAPFLLHEVTGIDVFDALVCPFVFSIKYFASM